MRSSWVRSWQCFTRLTLRCKRSMPACSPSRHRLPRLQGLQAQQVHLLKPLLEQAPQPYICLSMCPSSCRSSSHNRTLAIDLAAKMQWPWLQQVPAAIRPRLLLHIMMPQSLVHRAQCLLLPMPMVQCPQAASLKKQPSQQLLHQPGLAKAVRQAREARRNREGKEWLRLPLGQHRIMKQAACQQNSGMPHPHTIRWGPAS